MNLKKTTLLACLVVGLTACASSHVLVGSARPRIDPQQVKVYLEPPAKYETVALLQASDLGAAPFSAQGRMNKVMNRLKAEAAEVGANGVLIQVIETSYVSPGGAGKEGKALAIYVPESGVDGK